MQFVRRETAELIDICEQGAVSVLVLVEVLYPKLQTLHATLHTEKHQFLLLCVPHIGHFRRAITQFRPNSSKVS